jgi:cytidylate kinase
MLIIISGPPGSGKTTIAKLIAGTYGWEFVSSGQLFRQTALEKGMSVLELNKEAEKNIEIDELIDRKTVEISFSKERVVLETHVGAWILKNSRSDMVSVYLTAPIWERAHRIANRDGKDVMSSYIEIVEREFSHRKRFYEYYGIDITDLSVFDIVVNTSGLTPQEVFNIVNAYIRLRMKISV